MPIEQPCKIEYLHSFTLSMLSSPLQRVSEWSHRSISNHTGLSAILGKNCTSTDPHCT